MTGDSRSISEPSINLDPDNTSFSDENSDDFFMDNSYDIDEIDHSDESNRQSVIVDSKVTVPPSKHSTLILSDSEDSDAKEQHQSLSRSSSKNVNIEDITEPKPDKPSGRTRGRSVMKESVVEINSSESDLDEDKNLPRSRSRSRSSIRSISPA
ncbi:CIC_HP2_G0010490.mRNA.1.CDS.1 [Saccharomyces cerevisiae]|nr:CIC_HP2_G0010490.mRNA.1.CDS.1 [Saccharomyces cerevisiae]CAI6428208.1 CIC_HP2_G0010490.mRNA.1.CDS.1 [Saccharomyces cerevisiae]CAI6433890.1 CIC_HP1_G0010930.mRNA.1.CDS.1 [Saccharomyces cerevisiae]